MIILNNVIKDLELFLKKLKTKEKDCARVLKWWSEKI